MRNFIKIGVLACAISSFALSEGAFIGVEGGYVFNSQISGDSGSKIKGKAPNIGIKGGYAWDDIRGYVQYNHVFEAKKTFNIDKKDEEVKWTNDEFLIGADWTPAINDSAKLVVGVYTGASRLNAKDGSKEYDTGWLLGGKLGAIVSMNDNLEFEGGLKADKTFGYEYGLEQNKFGAYTSLNFKF